MLGGKTYASTRAEGICYQCNACSIFLYASLHVGLLGPMSMHVCLDK
jgi:hypothetical protein